MDEEIETCVNVVVKDSKDAKTTPYVICDKKWVHKKRDSHALAKKARANRTETGTFICEFLAISKIIIDRRKKDNGVRRS